MTALAVPRPSNVYFNPEFGNLHLVATGNSIAGKWKRTDGYFRDLIAHTVRDPPGRRR